MEAQLLDQPAPGGGETKNWGPCQPVPDYDEIRQKLDADSMSAGDLPPGAEKEDSDAADAAEKAAAALG